MMKKLLALLLLLLCPLARAEDNGEYVLKGALCNAVMTQAGISAALPDGLTVYPQIELTDGDDPLALIPVCLPGMNAQNATELLVCRMDILKREDYTGVYDLPTARIPYRVPLYASPEEDDRGVLNILLEGDIVTALAHIDDYFYVSDGTQHGYVEEDVIQNFRRSEETYRIYSRDMRYHEVLFVPGEPDGTEAVTADQALALARDYLIVHHGETAAHLDTLVAEVEFNISHIYGEWGKTWFIQFFGPVDEWYPGELYEGIMTEPLELYYTLEVRVDNGETYLINIGDYG